MNWYALYTKPRWEKKVAIKLEEQGIETYCPQVTDIRQWSDRKKKVTTPLFNSYVFVHLEEKDRNKVFDIPGAIRYLFWLGKPAIVKDEEINTIKLWLEDETVQDLQVNHISPGDNLTIANGSFKGKEGIVQEIGKRRLKLVLKSLGLMVSVKVTDALQK